MLPKSGEGEKVSPYSRFNHDELILSDHLALDRTVLANERTLMAYMRTGVAFGAAGVALTHFLATLWATVLGWGLLLLAFAVMAIGVQRYWQTKRHLDVIINRAKRTSAQ